MSELKFVKIVSDGTPTGTRVIDTATGNCLPATSIAWQMDSMQDVGIATVKVLASIEVEGQARVYTLCPNCSKEFDPVRPEQPGTPQILDVTNTNTDGHRHHMPVWPKG